MYCDTALGKNCNHCAVARFDLPYEVDVRDGLVSFTGADPNGAATFHAEREGSGTIAFVDPRGGSAYGEVDVHVSQLDHLTMARDKTEREPTNLDIVLSTQQGNQLFVALWNAAGVELHDTSLQMQLPSGAERDGDRINLVDVASGSYTLGFQSSGKSFTEPLEIVNEADAIELWEAPATIPRNPIVPGALEYVCFMAKRAGRYITGLRWQHVVDGLPAEVGYSHGCVLATTDQASGQPVTFTATAGGRSLTIQIPAR
jgi:hypothetical protein